MRRRDLMIQVAATGQLPDGYTRVEYLANQSTTLKPYIDTGVIPNQDIRIQIKAKRTNPMRGLLYGSRDNASSFNAFLLYCDGRADAESLAESNSARIADSVARFNLEPYNSKVVIDHDKQKIMVTKENRTYITASIDYTGEFVCAHSLTLFNCWLGNGVTGYEGGSLICNIYYAKIYDGENLVRDFVPCLDADGKPCFYDLVNGQTYYNRGNGSFTWGEIQ